MQSPKGSTREPTYFICSQQLEQASVSERDETAVKINRSSSCSIPKKDIRPRYSSKAEPQSDYKQEFHLDLTPVSVGGQSVHKANKNLRRSSSIDSSHTRAKAAAKLCNSLYSIRKNGKRRS